MSRFFFHVRDGDDVRLDPCGTMLPDLASAVGRSLLTARRILSSEALDGSMPMNKRIEVEDDQGLLVHVLPFVHAVEFKFNARYKYGTQDVSFPALGYTREAPAISV
jgi:outer membrane receptor for Fe3+-dicitrate